MTSITRRRYFNRCGASIPFLSYHDPNRHAAAIRKLNGGRSVIGEYSMRSVGSHGCLGGFHGCVDFFGRLFTLELCLGVMKMQDCGGLEMWRRSFRLSVLPNCDCRAKAQGSRYNPFRRPHRRCLDRAY